MMQKLMTIIILSLVVLVACQPSEPIKLKFAHVVRTYFEEDTPKGFGVWKFKQLVNERLAGKVLLEECPNSLCGEDDQIIKDLLGGKVQLAAPSLAKFGTYTKRLQIFDLPFLFDSPQTVDDFQQGPVGQELLHSMVDKGLLGLAYWHNGMKQLSANKPLRFPSDATGLKFRIQKSKVLDAQFKALGAIPVQLNFKETYTALKIGKVDGQENTWSNCVAEKYSEVQKYFSETNHGVLDYLLVTNVEFWNGLPSEIRAELETIIREVTLEVNKRAMESALRDRQKIIYPGGAAVLTLTKEELAQWRNTMQPVWDEFKDEIGEEMIKEVATAVNNQP